MNRRNLAVLLAASFVVVVAAGSATADTLSKVRQTGAITLGVRPYTGTFSSAPDDARHGAFQVEVCQWVMAGVRSRLALPKLAVRYVTLAPDNGLALLQSGAIDADCSTGAHTLARERAAGFSLTTYVRDGRTSEPVAIMLRKDDAAFKKMIDDTLAMMMRSGDMADLYHQWVARTAVTAGTRSTSLPNAATLQAWAHPNDRAAEAYLAP